MPTRSPSDPLVVLVRSPTESEEVLGYVEEFERQAEAANDITVVTYPMDRRFVHTAKGRKKRDVMKPGDAYRLYDQLHYSPVLVIVFSRALVSKAPSGDEPPERALITVEEFVRHKATYFLVQGHRDVSAAFSSFNAWRAAIHNEGEDDPRTLPLHMFTTSCDCSRLGTEAGNRAFYDRHGTPSSRLDDRRLAWNRAARGEYHGQPVLRIAGRTLSAGMHWDVSSRRGGRVENSIEVWRVTGGPNSYANVFPNAHIHVPGKSTARKVWPLK
jgi:hypothetical protein